MRFEFFRTLSALCFKSTLSTYEPTMLTLTHGDKIYVSDVWISSVMKKFTKMPNCSRIYFQNLDSRIFSRFSDELHNYKCPFSSPCSSLESAFHESVLVV